MEKNFRRLRKIQYFCICAVLLFFLAGFNLPAQEEGVQAEASPAGSDTAPAEATEVTLSEAPFGRPLRQQTAAAASPLSVLEPEPLPSSLQNVSSMDNELVRHYIRQYSSTHGKEWLNAVMKRAEPFIPFIREEIAKRNLPPELLYLPVIESGYLSTARSRSGAVGLWQFMKNSIGPFDMKVNEWVDERRDFWKSTDGALRKLEENFNYFNDWPLALAAYNAGMGAVSRLVKQTGINDYWLLSEQKKLKKETIHYVPKLLAVAYILSTPRRFGLEARWPEDLKWERIPVGRAASLSLLASEAGVDPTLLRMANQELETPVIPYDKNYLLKVPASAASLVAEVLLREDLDLIKYYFHTVRSGDTLLALALHYGVSVDQIEGMNPGIKARFLRIGQRIVVPAFKDVGPYEGKRPSADGLVFNGNHLVKRGESLWSIALAYDVAPEVLAEINGMEMNGILREGRSLKVP